MKMVDSKMMFKNHNFIRSMLLCIIISGCSKIPDKELYYFESQPALSPYYYKIYVTSNGSNVIYGNYIMRNKSHQKIILSKKFPISSISFQKFMNDQKLYIQNNLKSGKVGFITLCTDCTKYVIRINEISIPTKNEDVTIDAVSQNVRHLVGVRIGDEFLPKYDNWTGGLPAVPETQYELR